MPRKLKNLVEGAAATNDTLEGTNQRDTFVLTAGGGDDTVTGFVFDRGAGDRILLDSGTGVYDGILPPLGYLFDGQVFENSAGTATFEIHAVDANGDGVTDTQIVMISPDSVDSITLLGVAPDTITSAAIYGG